ncbi:Extracellular metalloprotease, partial [Colletotrichum shisoi]
MLPVGFDPYNRVHYEISITRSQEGSATISAVALYDVVFPRVLITWRPLVAGTAGLAMVSLATAQEKCGSEEPAPEAYKAAVALRAAQRAEGIPAGLLSKREEGLLITTYLHVVEDKVHRRFITDTVINDQMRVLNETFAPHNIQFVVKNLTHTVNDAWMRQARITEKAEALRQGAYNELNIYFETGLVTNPNSANGVGSFPVEDPLEHGHHRHLVGKSATHEVGHWFGLFHVFDGFDCYGEGGLIDDTPATTVATVGCPETQDSCPDHPGLDPIHNYMDYTKHAWEVERMRRWAT